MHCAAEIPGIFPYLTLHHNRQVFCWNGIIFGGGRTGKESVEAHDNNKIRQINQFYFSQKLNSQQMAAEFMFTRLLYTKFHVRTSEVSQVNHCYRNLISDNFNFNW